MGIPGGKEEEEEDLTAAAAALTLSHPSMRLPALLCFLYAFLPAGRAGGDPLLLCCLGCLPVTGGPGFGGGSLLPTTLPVCYPPLPPCLLLPLLGGSLSLPL